MCSVAVRTAGSLLQHAQAIAFAVVAIQVGFNSMAVDMIAVHHYIVTVALDAGINMEHSTFNGAGRLYFLNAVQPMTIRTAGCIGIAFHQRYTMN
jgi:hypothetical protein